MWVHVQLAQKILNGLDFEVDYPEQVLMVDGHPELFVSNGSHGNWGAPGELKYKLSDFPIRILAKIAEAMCSIKYFLSKLLKNFRVEIFFGKFFNPIPTGNIQL